MKNNDVIFKEFSKLVSLGLIKTHSYKSKDFIFKEGDLCKKVCYILSGSVEIATLSYNGNIEVISIVEGHNFFGQYLLFQDEGRYLGDVVSLSPVTLIMLSKEELLNLFMKNKQLLEAYISLISKDSFIIKRQVKLLSHKNALDRVIYYLESNSKDNNIEIESVSFLAKEINLPRETVSRCLTKLENDSFIERTKNKIILLK